MINRTRSRARPITRRSFGESYGSLIAKEYYQRSVLKGFLASARVAALGTGFGAGSALAQSTLAFTELARVRDAGDHRPVGYRRQVLIYQPADRRAVGPGIDGRQPRICDALPDVRKAAGDEAGQVNVANPHGHIVELVPPGVDGALDFAADSYAWDVFVLCGDPAKAEDAAMFQPDTSASGWFTDPDNLSVDPEVRLWVTTDGPPPQGIADALYVMETDGPMRGLPGLFYIAPVGSECCSPAFTPDGSAMFVSVQHPGELRMEDTKMPRVSQRQERRGPTLPTGCRRVRRWCC